VSSLVQSIKQHKNFKQLASYSVQCLMRAMTPPTVGWERNMKEAYESGAMEAISEVITRHKGDENVLAASTTCLASMATNPKYAAALVESGAIMGLIDSVASSPTGSESTAQTLQLLETIATTNPEALLAKGGAEATIKLLRSAGGKNAKVQAVCARTLEKLNRVAGAGSRLIGSGAVEDIMRLAATPAVDTDATESVEASLRMLERMCRQEEQADYIRTKLGGMESLTAALEVNRTNERVCKQGGRVLSKLASGNMTELVTRMEGTTSGTEREFLSGLLANLALEEENADKIVRSGGVKALLRLFQTSASSKTVQASARALTRLAANEANMEALVRDGAIETIVRMVSAAKDGPDGGAVLSSLIPTLAKLGSSEEGLAQLQAAGGVESVLSALRATPHVEASSLEAVAFLEGLGTAEGTDLGDLVAKGAIPAVLGAMKAHPKNLDLQLNGSRCLVYLSYSEGTVAEMVAAGALPLCLANLSAARKDVVLTTLYLLTSVSLVKENKEALATLGGTEMLLTALATYSSEDAVKETAQELLSGVVGAEQVADNIKAFASKVEAAIKSRSKTDMAALAVMANRLAGLAATQEFAELMLKADGVRHLVSAMDSIAKAGNLPEAEVVLAAIGNALFTLSHVLHDDPVLSSALATAETVAGVANAIKAAPKLAKHVINAVRFIDRIAANPNLMTVLADNGVVEALAAAMRANLTDVQVSSLCVGSMLSMASTDAGALQVAKHGGTRQVIATVHANSGTPGFSEPMEKCLALLQRVAMTGEGAEALAKQGAVEAVIVATEALTRTTRRLPGVAGSAGGDAAPGEGAPAAAGAGAGAAPTANAGGGGGRPVSMRVPGFGGPSAAVQAAALAASAKVLSRLLTADDAETAIAELKELATAAGKGRLAKGDVMLPILGKVGHLATVAAFAETLVRGGAAGSLTAIAATVFTKLDDSKPEDADLKQSALASILKALAGMSKVGLGADAPTVSAIVGRALEAGRALLEGLEVIRNLAASSEASAAALLADGRTLAQVITALRENQRSPDVATACFHALAALASHDSTAPVVAGSAALALVSAWIDDNLEDASRETVEAALLALSAMARSPPHAAALLAGGAVELIKAVLVKVCQEGETPAPTVLAASVGMLKRLGTSPAAIATITTAGGLRRVLRAMASHAEYMADESVAGSVLEFIAEVAAAPGTAEELAAVGAQELVLAGMTLNGASDRVTKAGAAALQQLGVAADASKAALAEVASLCAAIEAAGGNATPEQLAKLGDAVQRLGNLLAIEGATDPAALEANLHTLADAVALMAASDLTAPDVLAAAVQTVARLVEQATNSGSAAPGTAAADAVNVVMDVMCLHAHHGAVRDATVHALGSLASTAAGLKAISDSGGLKTISDVAKRNAGDAKLQKIVDDCMGRVAGSVSKNAVEMVAAKGGSTALAAVVEAASADMAQLSTVLCSIVAVEGGDEALYEVVGETATTPELMAETLRVLRDKVDSAGSILTIPGNAKRLQGLTKTLGAALSAQASLTPASDQRSKMQALRMAENTLTLLARMEFDSSGADAFFRNNGVASMLSLLSANFDDEDTVAKIVSIMSGAMEHASPEHAKVMALTGNMGAVVGVLKMYQGNNSIAAGALKIMTATARTLGAEASGIDAESMRLASAVGDSESGKGSAEVQAALTGLQTAFSSRMASVEAATAAMKNGLAQATAAMAAIGSVQELTAPDGRKYYYDAATGVTTWEAPEAFAALKVAMATVSEVAEKQTEENVAAADKDSIGSLLHVLQTHVRNPELATQAALALATLASNAVNAELIVASGGIEAAIAAIQTNPDNVALLRVLVILMERISRNDAYKQQIVSKGGLDLIISLALQRHVAQEEICNKSLSTIANLAFNSEPNIAIIMAKNGVKAIEKALQTWPQQPRIMENAMCALSNLMYGSEENKLVIGQTCGDEVTKIIRDHIKDANLFKMAMRALGNLAYCDENIRFIVEGNNATKAIVAGMRAHPADEEALQLAMEVIGNFASLEEAPPELDEDGNEIDPKDSIAVIILRDAGCAEILATMKKHPHNSALLKAGMDALCNIANDMDVTALMARKQGLVKLVIDIMQSHDWDEEIIKHAVQLLATICYSRECLAMVAGADGIQVLLAAMEQHGSNHDLLVAAQLALTNLAGDESARGAMRNMDTAQSVLALVEGHLNDKLYVNEAIKTLTRLAGDDDLSRAIASAGMHVVMAAVDKHARDAEFLTDAFRLLGHLAFVEANLTVIVQHNGIKKIVAAIMEHPDHQPLMLRSIQTIDNIAMANKENAAIVIEEGGKELIEMIMEQEQYAKDADIQRYGKSALLSMSALENLSKSAEITAKAAKASQLAKIAKPVGGGAAPSKPADPLAEFRHVLSAGKVMKVWAKGSANAAHVLVSPDFKSIVWQDVGSQKKLGALDLRQVSAIKAGVSDGHKGGMFGSKPKEPDACFSVVGVGAGLDVECTTIKDAKTWVEGLGKLLLTYKTAPHLL